MGIETCFHPNNQKKDWAALYSVPVLTPNKINEKNNCGWHEKKKGGFV